MKSFVQQIINEARTQRTIDSKIWASMSSASSKNRANGAVDVKPMRRDDANVLLQKYVAGLLTIKAECPATVTDIEKIGSYKLIGQAAIDAGVSLSQIQKLYVENGGTFNGDIKEYQFIVFPEGSHIGNEYEYVGCYEDKNLTYFIYMKKL